MYEFEIPCIPVPWKAHGGTGRRAFNPRYVEKEFYQFHIKRQYTHNLPIVIAVAVEADFYFPVPVGTSKVKTEKMLSRRIHHIKRPDLDNCCKFLLDCIKEIVIKDDSQVISLLANKLYSDKSRTIVKINLA